MNNLLQDFRYAGRTLSKAPGFALVAVLTLALGIGANSTIFSWINSTLLNPLPGVSDSRGLVSFTRGGDNFNNFAFSYPDINDLRSGNKSFSGMIAFNLVPVNMTGVGNPERLWAAEASANYFDVLGVRAIRGRTFLPEEEEGAPGSAPVVVISYGLWQTHFAGRDSVVGQKINLNRHPFTIVGVAPPLFQGTQTGLYSDLWAPLVMQEQFNGSEMLSHREMQWLLLMGRLRQGVPVQQAEKEMALRMQRIARDYPDSHRISTGISLFSMSVTPFGANGAARLYLLLPMLLAIAAVVLLLACVNVANLVLVRSVARRRELAIRLSLGAGRWRLVRQLLVENLLLSLCGGVVAILITTWSAGTFTDFVPHSNLPVALAVPVDRSVLLATMMLSVATSVIFGILPALRASRLTPVTVLKEESGSASGTLRKARLSSALVVVQLSLSMLLLVCAGLFLRSFHKTQSFDPGFNANHVAVSSFELLASGMNSSDGLQFERRLQARLETLPVVQSVSMATWLPLQYMWRTEVVAPENYVPREQESMQIGYAEVSPNYLKTLEIPLLAGREFTSQDTDKSQPVVMVNRAFVDSYWPGEVGVGRKVVVNGQSLLVVGVAQTSNYAHLNEPPQPFMYRPLFQHYSSSAVIHARVSGDPARIAPVIEKAVHELAPDLPVFDVSTLKERVEVASMLSRIAGTLVGAFGAIALVLAAVGIYAVIAYTTRQRVREIGIRMAMGAQAGDIRKLIMGQGLRLTIIGLSAGMVGAILLTRFLRALLFGVASSDALTFTAVLLLLSLVALAASYIPARRAMKVEPTIALRYE